MTDTLPGVFFVAFQDSATIQTWAFTMAPGTAAEIADAYEGDDWVAEILADYGALEPHGDSTGEVVSLGFTTTRYSLDDASLVMTQIRSALAIEAGEADLGEVQMIEERDIDDAPRFESEADILEACA